MTVKLYRGDCLFGHNFGGIEIDPGYMKIARRRIAEAAASILSSSGSKG